METAINTLQKIYSYGQSVADDSLRIIPDDFSVGQCVPQGDINIWRLAEVPPHAVTTTPLAQLAPGTTRGSRHCVKTGDLGKCEFFELPNANPLQGPIIVFAEPVEIEHPEHGNHLWPAGVVAITYQRRYSDEIRRIED